MSVAPPGIDQWLWNFAALVAAIQGAQATPNPTAIQIQAIQTAQQAVEASFPGAIASVVVSQGQAPAQQPVTPP